MSPSWSQVSFLAAHEHLSVWQCKANIKIKICSLYYLLMSSGPLVFQVETLLFIQSVPGGFQSPALPLPTSD